MSRRWLVLGLLPWLIAATGPWQGLREDAALRRRLASLPRQAALAYFAGRPWPKAPGHLPVSGGVFVTLVGGESRHPVTRACWGRLQPDGTDLAEVICQTTEAALHLDYRQTPVSARELPHLRFLVSLVESLEPVPASASLRPKVEGLYLTDGRRGAVLLPGEALTSAWQDAACRRKAGIPAGAPVYRYRFHTLVIEEPAR